MPETTQAYQAAATTGITIQGRDGVSENYRSPAMEEKITAKPSDPTAIAAADSAANLAGAPYTDAARLVDVGHAPFAVISIEFDTAADRTATLLPVFYDASNNVLGVDDSQPLTFSTQKVGSTVLLDAAGGNAPGGMRVIDCKGACKVSFVVIALSGGTIPWWMIKPL